MNRFWGSPMRYEGMKSWQVGVGDAEPFALCALWVRDVERVAVAPDDIVPGPLDTGPLAAPSLPGVDQSTLAWQWRAWWASIVDRTERPPVLPPDLSVEPALDTPDPLGLARLPQLAEVVRRRWPEHLRWNTERHRDPANRRAAPNLTTGEVVREVEAELGRKLRPFNVRFTLLPVRDDRILRVEPFRYLVPEQVYDSPRWASWLRPLIMELG
jgi:hypothetical protein